MGFADKLKFWKHEEDPGFGPDPFAATSANDVAHMNDPFASPQDPYASPDPFRQPQPIPQQPQQSQYQYNFDMNRDMRPRDIPQYPQEAPVIPREVNELKPHNVELILTQLDTIKAMLEGIQQRLSNLERSRNDYKW